MKNDFMIRQLSADAQCMVKKELGLDEQVIWCDEPDMTPSPAEVMFSRIGQVVLSLVGLCVMGAGLFALWYKQDDVLGNQLIFLMFAVAGLLLLVFPWWRGGDHTPVVYVLTASRALIFDDAIYTYDKDQLNRAVLELRPDGTGDIILEVLHSPDKHNRHDMSYRGSNGGAL